MAGFLILSPSGWWHLGHSCSWVGGGVSLHSFVLFFNFQNLSGRPSCAFFDIAHFDILNEIFKVRSVRRLPDVTSSPGFSLSSSTNERGRSHLGCYHPVIQWYCCNMVLQESKWKSLPKNTLLPKNMSFCQPSRFLRFPRPLGPSTGILLATLDT